MSCQTARCEAPLIGRHQPSKLSAQRAWQLVSLFTGPAIVLCGAVTVLLGVRLHTLITHIRGVEYTQMIETLEGKPLSQRGFDLLAYLARSLVTQQAELGDVVSAFADGFVVTGTSLVVLVAVHVYVQWQYARSYSERDPPEPR